MANAATLKQYHDDIRASLADRCAACAGVGKLPNGALTGFVECDVCEGSGRKPQCERCGDCGWTDVPAGPHDGCGEFASDDAVIYCSCAAGRAAYAMS